jgi:hypothetical protein
MVTGRSRRSAAAPLERRSDVRDRCRARFGFALRWAADDTPLGRQYEATFSYALSMLLLNH